jgi:hypothetical protein
MNMLLSELRILYNEFTSRENVQKAITSIDEGCFNIKDVNYSSYIEDKYYYYSQDDYVYLHDGDVIHLDDSFYCEGKDENYHIDDMQEVKGASCSYYSKDYVRNNSDFYCYDGEYYYYNSLSDYDLAVAEDDNEVYHIDDLYYHDGDGWYTYEPDDDSDTYVRGYHNNGFRTKDFNNKSKYKIGYEIEKEDRDVKESICIDDFEYHTQNLWRKESDGSLDDEAGYELISPTFEFNITEIFKLIESNDELVKHINADYGKSCGGHINLSQKGLTGHELFDKIKGYTPLFYALYYGRVDKNYSKGKSNDDLKSENEKYQAIKIHDNRVEFRIISAVPNVKTLKWRTRLLAMILKNPTADVRLAYYNVDTKFTRLLSETYNEEKLSLLKKRFIKFTKEFEGLDLNN